MKEGRRRRNNALKFKLRCVLKFDLLKSVLRIKNLNGSNERGAGGRLVEKHPTWTFLLDIHDSLSSEFVHSYHRPSSLHACMHVSSNKFPSQGIGGQNQSDTEDMTTN